MSRIIIHTLEASKYIRSLRSLSIVFPNSETSKRKYSLHHRKNAAPFWKRFHSSAIAESKGSRESIVDSPLQGKDIPYQNLVEYVFDEMDEKHTQLTALTCGASGRKYSYGMIRILINKFAQAIISHCRMRPRETVGLLLPNLPEYVIACYGAMEAGLPVTFVNPLYTPNEIRRQFQNAEVKLIATIPQLLDVAIEVSAELIDYRGTISIGGEDDISKRVFGLESLLSADHEAELPGINPRELAILPYSSGTTGVPKGVMLSHYNLVANLVQLDHIDIRLHTGPDEPLTLFTVLPFFHIFGFNGILNISLKMKYNLISLPRFTPEDYIKCLTTYNPTALFVVPSLMNFLTEDSNVKKEDLGSVQYIQSGAAPLTDGLMQRFRQKFGTQITVRQGYGMTESSPVTVIMPNNAPPSKHSSIGILVPNTIAKIVDLTTGESQEANKPGELQIKGPQVMMGYLNNEKATNETIDEEGWLHTGDVGYYDDDKYFYIIDRCKELIKVKGNQVSPTELENLLLEIPDVADAAVVGIPDALADEIPRAFIVKKESSEITDKDILKYVNARVVHYKKLAGGVVFVNVIPRNPSGKILRNELKVNECKYSKIL